MGTKAAGHDNGLPMPNRRKVARAAAAAVVMFIALATLVVVADGPLGIDRDLASFTLEQRTKGLTTLMKAVTWLGSSLVLFPLLAALAALRVRRRGWLYGIAILPAPLFAFLSYNLVKFLLDRPRPPASLAAIEASGGSFPSGHACLAAATFGALALAVAPRLGHGRRLVLWIAASGIVAVVGFSRIYLGVHWMSDVIGAYLLASAWLAAVMTRFLPIALDTEPRPALVMPESHQAGSHNSC